MPDKTIKTFLLEVRQTTLQAFENQDYPFEELVEKTAIARDMGRNPVFDVMFTLQNMAEQFTGHGQQRPITQGDREPGLELNPIAKFDLTVIANEVPGGIALEFEYSAALFKKETVQRFCDYFKRIIAGLTANPGITITDIEMMSDEEKQQHLQFFEAIDTTIENVPDEQWEIIGGQIAEMIGYQHETEEPAME